MSHKHTTLFLICILCACLNGQCQPVKDALALYFSEYRANRLNTQSLAQIDKIADKTSILAYFTPYQTDSLASVRAEAYRLIGNLSSQEASKKQNSQKYIAALLQGLTDNSPQVRSAAARHLALFRPTYFEKGNVSRILEATRKATERGVLFKLLGYVGSAPVLDSLRGYEVLEMSKEERWALKLALSRLGDSASIAQVSTVFDNATGSSTDLIRLLPDFSYTKSRQVIGKMLKLAVDDKLRCRPQNPSSEDQIPCSYYIIPYLCYSIANFPVEVDSFGELVDDYSEAMKKIADWEKTKGETYLIQVYSYK
jgi:HEAT repeat protein